jgi:type IV pilus assembly protein PilC
VRNDLFASDITKALSDINDGNNLSDSLDRSKLFPKMVPQMISVGERTGKIDSVLDKVNDFYSRETLNMIANLSSLMEPIIMIIMAVGVGIMVAAVILPMYNLAGQF